MNGLVVETLKATFIVQESSRMEPYLAVINVIKLPLGDTKATFAKTKVNVIRGSSRAKEKHNVMIKVI